MKRQSLYRLTLKLLLLVLAQGAAVAQSTSIEVEGVVYDYVNNGANNSEWVAAGINSNHVTNGHITILSQISGTVFEETKTYDVKKIASQAFQGKTIISNVTISNGITTIGSEAFDGCTGITHLVLPSSITTLGSNAFGNNSNLRWIDMRNVSNSDSFKESLNGSTSTPYNLGVADFTLMYMPTWSSTTDFPGYITNAVYKESTQLTCFDFQFSRNMDYCVPYAFTATKTTALPQFAADASAYSVCLPYDQPVPTGGKVYSLNRKEDGSVYFSSTSGTMTAGKPYLLVATENVLLCCEEEKSIPTTDNASTTTDAVDGVTIHGTFCRISNADAAAASMYVLQAENTWKVVSTENSKANVPPFRAYLTLSDAQSANLIFSLEDDTDGISLIKTDTDVRENDAWYTLQGQRLSAPPSTTGIYIHHNRKIVVK